MNASARKLPAPKKLPSITPFQITGHGVVRRSQRQTQMHIIRLITMTSKILALLALLLPFNAFAAEDSAPTGEAEDANMPKSPPGQRQQETVALGGNRFFIFSGMPNEHYITGYTIDLIKVDNGVPHFDTLLAEDFDVATNMFSRSEGMAFFATSYHYDKASGQLDYTTYPHGSDTVYMYKYHFAGNTFKLDEVVSQKPCPKTPCKDNEPKVIYKADQHAKAQ